MDERQRLFEIWAPPDAAFSPWAKPVLFTQMPAGQAVGAPEERPLPDQPWARAADGRTAFVLDLPGPDSVWHALALAGRDYRPVPLFNGSHGERAAVEVRPIITALQLAAPMLERARVRADAPPAFMLDANRRGSGRGPGPGWFDNRWIVFPQDFPSGRLLRSRGMERALLVRDERSPLSDDLAQVLARWKKDGVELVSARVDSAEAAPLRVSARWPFRPVAALALVALGLRRNSAGGFGARVPLPPEGGGHSGFA
ncbi:MAG TPA: hypothetical protein VFF69_12755 [Phycisphaerales bacterium]|nr:hypothetical protein [Phycisphaerales bacterium]